MTEEEHSDWTDESESEVETIKVVKPKKVQAEQVRTKSVKNIVIEEPKEEVIVKPTRRKKVKQVEEVECEKVEAPKPKTKKPRSKAQEEAWKRCLAKRQENRDKRLAEKKEAQTKYKKEAEEKIVKKAVRIKKKQAVRQAVLEDISSESDADEVDVKVVKKVIKKKQQKKKQPTPQVKEVEQDIPTLKFY